MLGRGPSQKAAEDSRATPRLAEGERAAASPTTSPRKLCFASLGDEVCEALLQVTNS